MGCLAAHDRLVRNRPVVGEEGQGWSEDRRRQVEVEPVDRLLDARARPAQGGPEREGVRLRKSPAVLDIDLSKAACMALCRGQ